MRMLGLLGLCLTGALLCGCGATSRALPGSAAFARRAASQTLDTVFVLTDTNIQVFPPSGALLTLPGNDRTLLAIGGGNAFLANGDIVQEYVNRVTPGAKIIVPQAVKHLRYGRRGTLLISTAHELYAYPKPYTTGRLVAKNLPTFNRIIMDSNFKLLMGADGLYVTQWPYKSVAHVAKKSRFGARGYPFDPTTDLLYIGPKAYSYPYGLKMPASWTATGSGIFRDFQLCGDTPEAANGGVYAVIPNFFSGATCGGSTLYVFAPPQTSAIASLAYQHLEFMVVGGDSWVYGVTSGPAPTLVAFVPPYGASQTLGSVQGTIRGIIVQ